MTEVAGEISVRKREWSLIDNFSSTSPSTKEKWHCQSVLAQIAQLGLHLGNKRFLSS